jgi:hypothetical protein
MDQIPTFPPLHLTHLVGTPGQPDHGARPRSAGPAQEEHLVRRGESSPTPRLPLARVCAHTTQLPGWSSLLSFSICFRSLVAGCPITARSGQNRDFSGALVVGFSPERLKPKIMLDWGSCANTRDSFHCFSLMRLVIVSRRNFFEPSIHKIGSFGSLS